MFTKKVAESSHWSYESGHWNQERFEPYKEMFAKKVAESAEFSYRAGYTWTDEKVLPYLEMFARKVAEDTDSIFDVLRHWTDERFEETAEIFLPVIKNSFSLMSSSMRNTYSERKNNIINLYVSAGEEGWNTFKKLEERNKIKLLYFTNRCDPKKVIDLPPIDLQRAHDILDYIESQEGGEDKFFESFNVVLARGEVRPWTKSVLQELQSAGQGGTNYRILEVAE